MAGWLGYWGSCVRSESFLGGEEGGEFLFYSLLDPTLTHTHTRKKIDHVVDCG